VGFPPLLRALECAGPEAASAESSAEFGQSIITVGDSEPFSNKLAAEIITD
jgi:hypothetical protein